MTDKGTRMAERSFSFATDLVDSGLSRGSPSQFRLNNQSYQTIFPTPLQLSYFR